MADGYGSAPKPTGKGVKPVPYEPKPGPWGIDTSWLDTPQQTPRLDGAATSLPAPPPLADMHGGGGNEVVNMTNMRAMMEALLAPVATSVLEVKAQVVQLDTNVRATYDEVQAQKVITGQHSVTLKQLQSEMQDLRGKYEELRSGTSTPAPSVNSTPTTTSNPAMENRADIDAIKNKLELRVCDKIATDVETAVTEILSQLATDLDTTGVKMSMKPMMGGKKTRVTLEFEDQDKRQEFRRTLVDKDNGYKPTTKLNGQNVEVYCPKPKYEIVRDDRLYKAGKQAARQRGTDFANVFVDRTNRIVTTSDGTIIAWQDQASWYARVGSPA